MKLCWWHATLLLGQHSRAEPTKLLCDVASFDLILESMDNMPNATIVYATKVVAGESSFDPSPEYPNNATNLPPACAVKFRIASSTTTSYNLAIFLPDQWNGRLMTTGNGGFGGGINYPDMGEYTHYGFASMSSDIGHLSDIIDSSWALQNPQSIIDWSYRALHGSVHLTKAIVPAYYDGTKHGTNDNRIRASYYTGCATGGRQGLRNVQLYPTDFDGVLVGDAAWQTANLQAWSTWLPLQNYPPNTPSYITKDQFDAITARITGWCDAQDGLADSIVQDPARCHIDYMSLLCSSGSGNVSNCLSKPQLLTLRTMFSSYTTENATHVFPGLSLGSNPSDVASTANSVGYGYFQNFVYNDTSYSFTNYTDRDFFVAESLDPGRATARDFDISAFVARGGKILMYHGLADGLIPSGSSVDYLRRTRQAMFPDDDENDDDEALSSFLRLFLVPGMNHCTSPVPTQPGAPWYIAAASQVAGIAGRLGGLGNATHSVPGFMDARHDSVLALMAWFEDGMGPDELVATKFVNDTAPRVERQRTLCSWPKVARYTGGDVDAAEAWVCSYDQHRLGLIS